MIPTPLFRDVAVLIPCRNEESTISTVVGDFQTVLAGATVYVFDNNSSDATVRAARQAGATVFQVELQGKGNVIRRMFADVEAEVYVLVDGDDTYDADAAPNLIEHLVGNQLDMIVGARISDNRTAYRHGHRLGNALLTKCVGIIFGRTLVDMLSGYRVLSRRFVKSFPARSAGFETETELSVHALEMRMPMAEVSTAYKPRPMGSESKLKTYRDGLRILYTILTLFKSERPLAFFSIIAGACVILSLILAVPLFTTYIETGLVPRFPTAILSSALVLFGAIFLACGLVLDTVTRGRAEIKRLAYLAIPAPSRRVKYNAGQQDRAGGCK